MLGSILENEIKTNIKMKKISDKLNEKINKNNAKPKLIEYNKKVNHINDGLLASNFSNIIDNRQRQNNEPRRLVEFQKYVSPKFSDNYLNLSCVMTPKVEDIINEYYSDRNLHARVNEQELQKLNNIKPNILLNPNIKVIHQVFQPKFANKIDATIVDDFIRGCYYLIQFCKEQNLKYDIDIYDHPIKNCIEYFKNKTSNKDLYISTNKLLKQNFSFSKSSNGVISIVSSDETDILVDFLNKSIINDGHIFVNIYYSPKMPIKRDHIQFMRSLLKPTYDIEQDVNTKLKNLSLKKREYTVLHVRMCDKYINYKNNNIDYKLIDKVISNMTLLPNQNYLLITDSDIIKKRIIDYYKYLNIKFFTSKISNTIDYENIEKTKNTMIDFYLMSYSKKIIGFSTLLSNSGIGLWCAITYDIPYLCKLVS